MLYPSFHVTHVQLFSFCLLSFVHFAWQEICTICPNFFSSPFRFDIESLPVFPTNLTSRRRYVKRLSTFVQQHPEDLIKSLEVPSLLSSYLIDEHISHAELEPLSQMHHVSPKFDKMAEVKPARKHVCYKSEASEVPSKKLQNDEGNKIYRGNFWIVPGQWNP